MLFRSPKSAGDAARDRLEEDVRDDVGAIRDEARALPEVLSGRATSVAETGRLKENAHGEDEAGVNEAREREADAPLGELAETARRAGVSETSSGSRRVAQYLANMASTPEIKVEVNH